MTDEQREALNALSDDDLIFEIQGRFLHTLLVLLKNSDFSPGQQESLVRYSGGIITAMGLASIADGHLGMAFFDEEASE